MPHSTPRLPRSTALTPRHIRLSPPAFPPRHIPPGGHHREAGESLGPRVGLTQPISEFGADGALPAIPRSRRGAGIAQMVMLTPAEKHESQRQQKKVWKTENNQAKPKKAQVPDAPEAHAGARGRTYAVGQQFNQKKGQVPEQRECVQAPEKAHASAAPAGYQRNRNEAQVPDELEVHAIARERTYARGPKQTSNSIGMREKYQRWIGKWKKRMEEAEAAKAGQRAAAELPK